MQAVVVARFVFGAEVCVFWFIESGVFHELLFDFDFDFDFVCWIDWGRHRHSSLSMSHTLQTMTLATKDALRFLHLWFIFRIWKNCISKVSVFDAGCCGCEIGFLCRSLCVLVY